MLTGSKNIYLDAISTTPVDPEVIKSMSPFWNEKFGNPSSIHGFGRDAIMALDEAREKVARFFGAREGEVYFTGSATEADNWALWGIAHGVAKKYKTPLSALHVVVSAIEHKAVLAMAGRLEGDGVDVTYVAPTKEGLVTAEAVKAAIKPNTILVSVMYVNNEVGSINDITAIGRVIEAESLARGVKDYSLSPKPYPLYLHTDAVQAVQFLDCRLDYIKADALTFSGHKIYGPKGVGGLVIRESVPLEPLIIGGGQEADKRSGTENVAGIVGLAKALELTTVWRASGGTEKIKQLRHALWQGIKNKVPKAVLNGPAVETENRVANNLNVCFKGADGESLLIALDLAGVACSAGSACAAGATEPSHVLQAMGCSEADVRASIRFGLGRQTTQEEIEQVIKILPELVAKVSR